MSFQFNHLETLENAVLVAAAGTGFAFDPGAARSGHCLTMEDSSMVILKNILVATDFSEPSDVALHYGRDMARSYSATLHVLHVVENVVVRYSPEIVVASPVLQENLESAARRDLDAVITDDDRRTLKVMPAVRVSANVAGGIVDYANEHSIDLIIVGTHGRSGVQRFLMGSVAERVVRMAPCPVLAVREHERDFLAPDALVAAAKA